jgi:hypothetical protein
MVGKQKRSQNADKPPLSSHPLFPALIALWFGALFGFGSLAIRRSLIESIVLKTQIDSVIESFAPPLGMTARIILALVMAVIGAIVGGMFARMLARPKTSKTPRRRKAGTAKVIPKDVEEESGPVTFGKNAARAAQVAAEAAAVEPVRRRPLTVTNHTEPDDDNFHFHSNSAPLPGGPPEIFDVKASDLGSWKQPDTIAEPLDEVASPLDLSSFEATAPAMMNGSAGDLDNIDYLQPAAHFSVFDPLPDSAPETASALGIPSAFEPEPAQPQSPFAEAQTDSRRFDAPDMAFDEPAVFSAPIVPVAYEAPPVEPQPQFAERVDVSRSYEAADLSFAAPELADPFEAVDHAALTPFGVSSILEPDSATPAIPEAYMPEPLAEMAPTAFADPVQSAESIQSENLQVEMIEQATEQSSLRTDEMNAIPPQAAEQPPISNANLDDLSSSELLERLALSMRKRATEAEVSPVAVAVKSVVQEVAPPVSAPQFTAAAPIAPATPTAMPAPEAAPPARLTIPAALKPINFSEYEEDDDDDDSHSFLPQRRMSQPVAAPTVAAQPPAPVTTPIAPSAVQHDLDNAAAAEPDVAEDGYSSLLDMSKPGQARQNFVRVDEPEADEGDIETVVVFPGQGSPTGTRFAAPAAPANPVPQPFNAAAEVAQTPMQAKNFAAPAEISQQTQSKPQQFAAPANPPAIDPAETERALRSALASLQRMTGAA